MTEHTERHLYAAWCRPERLIGPVEMLTRRIVDSRESYRFVYLKVAEQLDGFELLPGLPDLYRIYESDHLFPVFRYRQMPRRRPDYGDYLARLDLDLDTDPFEVMARSEGRRMTDRIEVFAHPDRTADGGLTTLFFARGMCHIDGADAAVAKVAAGEHLDLIGEPDNPVNPRAVLLDARTGGRVGWVPDYLVTTIHELREYADADVRIVAATHRDLGALVREGLFREDLYYRLNVVPIRMPPLRDRLEDLPLLTRHLLARASEDGMEPKRISEEALSRLTEHTWPGNVRELENLLRRMVVLTAGDVISADTVEEELGSADQSPVRPDTEGSTLGASVERHLHRYFAAHGDALPPAGLYRRFVQEVERPLILRTLRATGGNQIRAAELLGINRNTLRKKIRDLDLRALPRRRRAAQ